MKKKIIFAFVALIWCLNIFQIGKIVNYVKNVNGQRGQYNKVVTDYMRDTQFLKDFKDTCCDSEFLDLNDPDSIYAALSSSPVFSVQKVEIGQYDVNHVLTWDTCNANRIMKKLNAVRSSYVRFTLQVNSLSDCLQELLSLELNLKSVYYDPAQATLLVETVCLGDNYE